MRPFAPSDWPKKELQEAADILWSWHMVTREGKPSTVDQSKAKTVCKTFSLPVYLVDAQLVEGSMSKIETVPDLLGYADAHAGSHALLLAKLAGYTANWIEEPVKQFGRAIFLTRSICHLREDLLAGKHYIPLDMMEKDGVSISDLMEGRLSPMTRSLLWKQVIRARDAYASCRTLNSDLTGWCRRRFRVYWTGGLDLLARIESRKFDVWSKPLRFTMLRKTHLYLQIFTGKTN